MPIIAKAVVSVSAKRTATAIVQDPVLLIVQQVVELLALMAAQELVMDTPGQNVLLKTKLLTRRDEIGIR